MDGVFMKKYVKIVWTTVLTLTLFCLGVLLADKQCLRNDLVRLHVVADSDSYEDQQNKLSVRDAVISYLQANMGDIKDVASAKSYLQEQLPVLQEIANDALKAAGSEERAVVYLTKEAFDVREYDTFSLPSGVYESLRVDIGSAEGKNWWCVVFPSLCLPTSTETFQDTAVSSGLENGLVNTLSGEEEYEVRFFFLDCLGKLENFFFFG